MLLLLVEFVTFLAHVDVCGARVGRAGRAISFLVLVFASTLLLAFLERVDLQPVPGLSSLIHKSNNKVVPKAALLAHVRPPPHHFVFD